MEFSADNRIVTLILLLLSALMAALYPPGNQLGLLGLVAYAPLLVVLERGLVKPNSRWPRKLLFAWLCIMPVGFAQAAWGMDWIASSIHVFGGVAPAFARLLAGAGYGLEIAFLLFIGFALPLFFLRRSSSWSLAFRTCWMLLVDGYYPRLVPWSLGSATLSEVAWLQQAADLVGAWGLGLLVVSANLVVARLLYIYLFRSRVELRALVLYSIHWPLLVILLVAYGIWQQQPSPILADGKRLGIVAVQPNFSLAALASNPELTPSGRQFNLTTLLNDSAKGLSRLPDRGHPRLVIWPETAFPWRFFQSLEIAEEVKRFARLYNTAIILASTEQRPSFDGQKYFGLAIAINNQGKLIGRYQKITLMPFGEYIPGSQLIPGLSTLVNRLWPIISEFERGSEYKVFELAEGYVVAANVCFDATVPDISRRMANNGASLIVNLSNLAWFGYSKASSQLAMTNRWRAIENRVPVLMSSLNGETQVFNSQGHNQGQTLELFEAGVWAGTLALQTSRSFYRNNPHLMEILIVILLFVTLLGHRFSGICGSHRKESKAAD